MRLCISSFWFTTYQPSYINPTFFHPLKISTIQKLQISPKKKTSFYEETTLFLVMSALVDIWTSELAKLREKANQAISNPANTESSPKVQLQPMEESSTWLSQAFSRFNRVNSSVVLYSEASVSMIVDYLSAWIYFMRTTVRL